MEKLSKGSLGCAPDILFKLKSNGKIIVAEIKSLVGMVSDNSDFRRALVLGQNQLLRARTIIGKEHCADYGIIMFCYLRETTEGTFETSLRGIKYMYRL